jgi:hypothetical protein
MESNAKVVNGLAHRLLFRLWEGVSDSTSALLDRLPPTPTHEPKGYIMDITATPAYGRDYKSGPAVLLAWQEGMDFQIVGIHPDSGRYINNRDAERHANESQVWIRYSSLTKTIKVHG